MDMTNPKWPDALRPAKHDEVAQLLTAFWRQLAQLPELIARDEHLLCAACTGELRQIVLRMMLALNGIAWPAQTRHLNGYLSKSQRAAIEKTLLTPTVGADSWLGQAVALVVICRWYTPQLAAAYHVPAPDAIEQETLALLHASLPDWPATITTD
jgi:hypothetical protein